MLGLYSALLSPVMDDPSPLQATKASEAGLCADSQSRSHESRRVDYSVVDFHMHGARECFCFSCLFSLASPENVNGGHYWLRQVWRKGTAQSLRQTILISRRHFKSTAKFFGVS